MSFFEPPPSSALAQAKQRPPWLAPPANVLPGVVPVELLLARTEQTAVAVTGKTAVRGTVVVGKTAAKGTAVVGRTAVRGTAAAGRGLARGTVCVATLFRRCARYYPYP